MNKSETINPYIYCTSSNVRTQACVKKNKGDSMTSGKASYLTNLMGLMPCTFFEPAV
jgi:hypothetical protein